MEEAVSPKICTYIVSRSALNDGALYGSCPVYASAFSDATPG